MPTVKFPILIKILAHARCGMTFFCRSASKKGEIFGCSATERRRQDHHIRIILDIFKPTGGRWASAGR